jgi:hypothetical protein
MTHQQTSENPSRVLPNAFEGARLNERDGSGPSESWSKAIRRDPNTPESDMQLYRHHTIRYHAVYQHISRDDK